MNDVFNEALQKGIALHKEEKLNEAELIYNRLLNRAVSDENVLFLLSDLYLRKEYNGLAINLLSNLLQNNPSNALAWCNLGVGFRKENFYDLAKEAWMRSIKEGGETVEVCSNLAGLYADRAKPDKAIEWCDKAIKLDPENTEAIWQKSLALLTLGNWSEGWASYEARQLLPSWDSRKSISAPIWDGKYVDHLYIHGEQGIGDEVMFLSILDEVIPLVGKITLEVNKRVVNIVRQTWPDITVVAGEKEATGRYDAKIPIGSLARFYRNESFPGVPYLKPERVEFYKSELVKIGPPPYIAITWVGGTKMTRVEDRSINFQLLRPITEKYTCISAQYSHTNPMIEGEREQAGIQKINDESTGLDIAEQAALFKAVDAVVTVQQTAVHVAGAVGAKTYAMISSHPHWRYGLEGDMPWYNSVKLFRNKDDWGDVVNRVANALESDLC